MSKSRQNTRRLHRRLAVVFDFDDSLAPDSTGGFVEAHGVKRDDFYRKRVQPLVNDGWDPVPAVIWCLVQESRSRPKGRRFTRDMLVQHGRELELFDGVPKVFDRLQDAASRVVEDAQVHFFCISAGVGEIIRNTPVSHRFERIWASEIHYNSDGEIEWPKRVVSHTEKTRYLYQLATGTKDGAGQSIGLHRRTPDAEMAIPLDQIIYCGDGMTDVPCFTVLNEKRGVSLGLYKKETPGKWGKRSNLARGQRVANLTPVDFTRGSETLESLILAVESICKRIKLRERSVGE